MINPLQNFDWDTLYEQYDALSRRFNGNSEYLVSAGLSATSDRELYYLLISRVAEETKDGIGISPKTYKGILYWKLYSQPAAVKNILGNFDNDDVSENLKRLSSGLPPKIDRDINVAVDLITRMNKFSVRGMKEPTSFPVRTTFLHFVYPNVVPVFDKMVLQAVGENRKNANHDINVMREYVPFNWIFADKYKSNFKKEWKETPVRIIDMALWISRGN